MGDATAIHATWASTTSIFFSVFSFFFAIVNEARFSITEEVTSLDRLQEKFRNVNEGGAAGNCLSDIFL